MYSIDWHCPKCDACYKLKDRFVICPYDGSTLELQFKTVKYGADR